MNKNIISFIGSGGKTTVMLEIARKLKEQNKKIAITTTTKIYRDMNDEAIDFVCDDLSEENIKKSFIKNKVVVFGVQKLEKLTKPSDDFFEYVTKYCDYLLIEADGSKQKPLKITSQHEPVITENTQQIIAVFGLSAIGKNSQDACHRCDSAEIVNIDFFCNIIKLNINKIDKNSLKIVLNQADSIEDIELAKKIRNKLVGYDVKIARKGVIC